MSKRVFFGLFLLLILLVPAVVSAADHCAGGAGCTATTEMACKSVAGCSWVVESASVSSCPSGSVCLDNPLGSSVSTPQALIGKIINAVLGVVGSLALLMFVYGGLTWMTSAGSAEKVKKGREIIVWSAVGLAIIFAAYGLVRILITSIK